MTAPTAPKLRLLEQWSRSVADIAAAHAGRDGDLLEHPGEDLAALGVGGHLTALRRTKIGSYLVEQAQSLEGLTPEALEVLDISMAARQQFVARELSEQDETDLRHGKRLKADGETAEPIAGFGPHGNLVAMLTKSGKDLKSLVVFAGSTDD